jgi:hypothetical protein
MRLLLFLIFECTVD